jgi:hypothetical protein
MGFGVSNPSQSLNPILRIHVSFPIPGSCPRLDRQWLEGGWTSHFLWETEDGDGAYLDERALLAMAGQRLTKSSAQNSAIGCQTFAPVLPSDRDTVRATAI